MRVMGTTHPIKVARTKLGLSLDELAGLVGVTKPTVWRWEAGKRKVDEELLPKVCKVLGLAPEIVRPDLAALFAGEAA